MNHRFPLRTHSRLLSVAIASCFMSAAAYGLPVMPTVANGAANFAQAGSALTITNSNGAIINWQSFNISAGETVRFVQPSSSSAVLNRVLSANPSAIFGTLSSNGKVWLVNPAGILVGAGAIIDTAGFVASTLPVRDEDFLASRLTFGSDANAPGSSAVILNQGTIKTPLGGSVYLIATQVTNEGVIQAPRGEVILASGNKVELMDTGTPGVNVEISGNGATTNLGQIISDAGRIGLVGSMVRNQGVLNASSVSEQGGRIFLKATQDLVVDGEGRILATGQRGGQVDLLGKQTTLGGTALVDASGLNGGGVIRVGGTQGANNPDLANAQTTVLDTHATLRADAIEGGNGGTVTLWAEDKTSAHGTISVQGGRTQGDGGLIETSARNDLNVDGLRASAAAPAGKGGKWLLDPIGDFDITDAVAATYLNFIGSEIDVEAANNINVDANVVINTAATKFVANAGNNINLNANITTNGGDIVLNANSSNLITGSPSGVGAITRSVSGGNLTTGGGSVMLTAKGNIDTGAINTTSTQQNAGNINVLNNGHNVQISAIQASGGNDISGSSASYGGDGGSMQINIYGQVTQNQVSVGSIDVRGGNSTSGYGGNAGFVGIGFSGSTTPYGGSINLNTVNLGGGTGSRMDGSSGSMSIGVSPGYGGAMGTSQLSLGNTTLVGAAEAFISGRDIQFSGNFNAPNSTLHVAALDANISQGNTAAIVVDALYTESMHGNVLLPNFSNTVKRFAANAPFGGVQFGNSGNLATDTENLAYPGERSFSGINAIQVVLATGGRLDITAGAPIVATGTGNALMMKAAQLNNLAGSTGLSTPNGRWLAYTTSPSLDVINGLSYAFRQFNFVVENPILGSGNGFLYATNPVVTAQLSGTASKVYDGTLLAPTSQLSAQGTMGSEILSMTVGSAQFLDRNAGNNKTVTATLSDTVIDGGGKPVFGLTLPSIQSAAVGTITPKELTVQQVGVQNKVYDGTLAATLSGGATFSGVVGGDVISVNTAASSAHFNDKNVGTAKPVTLTQITLGGTDASNYTVGGDLGSVASSANITPATVTVSGLSAQNKVYDATTTATITGSGVLSGVIQGDSLSLASTGSTQFSDKNVGNNKTIVLSGFTLGGADAGNYTVAAPGSLTANITPATLSITGLSAQNKVYDGTATAPLTGSATLSGVIAGDVVSLGPLSSGLFDDKNVGTHKTVTFRPSILSGTDAGNYVVAQPNNLFADITRAPLLISGLVALNRTYNGTTNATLSGSATFSGLVAGDSVSINTVTSIAHFDNKNVGNAKPVTVTQFDLTGADAGNYLPTSNLGGITANITPAPLTLAGLSVPERMFDGTTSAPVTGSASLSGVVAGDTVTLSGVINNPSFNTPYVGAQKPINLGNLTIGGTDAGNYTFQASLTGTIFADPANFRWVGNGSGAWENSANWNQGVIPVVNADVALPFAGSVTYSSGSNQIRSLQSSANLSVLGGTLTLGTSTGNTSSFTNGSGVTVNGGTLVVNGSLTTPTLQLSSGNLNGSGDLNVTSQYTQTGGTLGTTFRNLSLTSANDFNVAAFRATNQVSLTSANGALLNTAGNTITAPIVVLKARTGIGSNGALTLATGRLTAVNEVSGELRIVNTGQLDVAQLQNSGGGVHLENTGALSSSGPVTSNGALDLITHSPLTIGSSGITATGDIHLVAGATNGSNDDLTLNGAVSSTGGSIILSAGDTLYQNANVITQGGQITESAETGSILMTPHASTQSHGGTINFASPHGNILLGNLDAGPNGGLSLNAGGSIAAAPGAPSPQIIGGVLSIVAGGDVFLDTDVQLLEADIGGRFSIFDTGTGQTVSNAVNVTDTNSVLKEIVTSTSSVTDTTDDTSTTGILATILQQGESNVSRLQSLLDGQTIGGSGDQFGGSEGEGGTGSNGSNKKGNGNGDKSNTPSCSQ